MWFRQRKAERERLKAEREKAEWDKFVAETPPEILERLMEPLPADFDPDDVISDEELEEITQRAIARAEESRPCEQVSAANPAAIA